MTAFLVALAQHEIDAPIFPDNLLRHTPSFTPHTAHPDEVERANRAGSAPSAHPVQSDDIRQWAWRSGHEVPDRGRIPAAVRKAYDDGRPWP
ncbi:histone-like nucleoid-structuring protein Lsr2 [Streptomyces decoyicus]|uniref:Lsr2 family DNA-binding protein n=1 Tax=Streptomyces decoyicus TaxID=249567 RepID=UPI00365410C1